MKNATIRLTRDVNCGTGTKNKRMRLSMGSEHKAVVWDGEHTAVVELDKGVKVVLHRGDFEVVEGGR